MWRHKVGHVQQPVGAKQVREAAAAVQRVGSEGGEEAHTGALVLQVAATGAPLGLICRLCGGFRRPAGRGGRNWLSALPGPSLPRAQLLKIPSSSPADRQRLLFLKGRHPPLLGSGPSTPSPLRTGAVPRSPLLLSSGPQGRHSLSGTLGALSLKGLEARFLALGFGEPPPKVFVS